MARSLTTNEVAQFDAEVKQAYQKSSILRGAIRLRATNQARSAAERPA